MKTMTVGDLKSNFSEALKAVQNGEEIAVAFGKKREIIAYLVQKKEPVKRRKLGTLKGKGKVTFAEDFKMTTEEFLGL